MIPDYNNSNKTSPIQSVGFMPQLDSLRAFAVFFVLIEHWLYKFEWLKILPFGMIGVTLFFVLSGFLITQILISSRVNVEATGGKKIHSIKQFYIRRTLRIFPIYYITLFILYIFNVQNIREKFLWFLFYASNIYFYKINNWAGSLSHLWTLAVEEQFYIIWPFIILFIPKKYLLKSIIGIIIFGPVFRTYLFILSGSSEWVSSFIHILTPACMDCFGLGALLAYYKVLENDRNILRSKPAFIFLIINIASVIILTFFEENAISIFLFRFHISLICMFIIHKAITGFSGVTGKILENPVIMFLGRISYGLYLYHNFIPMIYSSLGLPALHNIYVNFMLQMSILVIISMLSWYLIEKPINSLKKYFSYN
ncbi:MAG: acyltransferase [Bacteroidota bacterium]|nr:acyltransferase [Bacteroidota bacterium]